MYFSSALRSSLKTLAFSALAGFVLLSCSSTQNVYDDDGIYNSGTTQTAQEQPEAQVAQSEETKKYKDFFQNGAKKLEDIPEEGAIFTDIEEYTSESDEEYVDEEVYEEGNADWGEETDNTVVYVYNNSPYYGFNRFGFGGFGFNRFGYGGFGYGGFNNFGFGFNRFGYGWPYYGGFGYGGFGYAWNPFFYGNGFYNRLYFVGAYNGYAGNAVAYNNSNRAFVDSRNTVSAATAVADSRSRLRSSSNSARRASSRSRTTYSRNRGTVRTRGTNDARRRSTTTQTRRPTTTRRSSSPSRPSQTRRSSVPQRRSSSTTRSSSDRSSKTRSSGSSSRRRSNSSRSSSRSSGFSRSGSSPRGSSRGGFRSSGRRG